MTTTTEQPPLPTRRQPPLPTRRQLRAAERERDSQTTGAAVSPPAAPVPTPDLPSRRSLRAAEQASRGPGPARSLTEAVTGAVALPFRAIGDAVSATRAIPVTATAVAACLVVSVATPQAAVASTPQVTTASVGAPGQQYVAPGAVAAAVERDAFDVGARRAPAGRSDRSPAHASGPDVVRPVAGTIPPAGGFGGRQVAGCGACSTNHQGLDFAAPHGAPVVSVLAGQVVSAGVFGGYGNQVLVQHGDGTRTRYGHLSRIDVVVGQTVGVGRPIGAVGSTGVSTGAHLHFEVIVGGVATDPAPWLSARGVL
ncbi:peptidoglycan DD-metalloendopeptidase family protein [Curtobacterium sp. NPDC089689]|uniref:M23 family metallopeptidase n=1 Tax=Curtobacterium sp. NPDC089689 TaxID=3363968 RepID=UPI0038061286